MKPVLCILGTRPEVVKLAPVVRALRALEVQVEILSTGQHRDITDRMLKDRGMTPTHQWHAQSDSLDLLVARILDGASYYVKATRPGIVLVQGDTASAYAGALAAFHAQVPIGHVEAGLRTSTPSEPFPEEMYRRMISRMATLHFAPTPRAEMNLLAERVDGMIFMTGNPVVDELNRIVAQKDHTEVTLDLLRSVAHHKLVLVTCHRRERLAVRLEALIAAVERIAQEHPDIEIVWPLHPNPAIANIVNRLIGRDNVHIVEPMPYSTFLSALRWADVVITDSGGVIEEADTLARNLLIIREETERPEALDNGAKLVPMKDMIRLPELVNQAFLDIRPHEQRRSAFGDGQAGPRIAELVKPWLVL